MVAVVAPMQGLLGKEPTCSTTATLPSSGSAPSSEAVEPAKEGMVEIRVGVPCPLLECSPRTDGPLTRGQDLL